MTTVAEMITRFNDGVKHGNTLFPNVVFEEGCYDLAENLKEVFDNADDKDFESPILGPLERASEDPKDPAYPVWVRRLNDSYSPEFEYLFTLDTEDLWDIICDESDPTAVWLACVLLGYEKTVYDGATVYVERLVWSGSQDHAELQMTPNKPFLDYANELSNPDTRSEKVALGEMTERLALSLKAIRSEDDPEVNYIPGPKGGPGALNLNR